MDLPGLVTSQLGTEEPLSQVPLGGEDLLLVTPSRTLVYRAEGLLRDESIASYPHDCDRVDLSTGRRKATLRLQYIDGPRDFSVPRDRLEDVLAPILRGVLSAADVTGADERVEGVYRFSELTYIITEGRVVKHIGNDLWSPDCEVFPFDDVTGLRFEEGSVATAVVLEVDGRPDRVKAPNEDARYVRRDLERVLFDYHDVDSLDALNEKLGRDESTERPTIGFEDDLDTLVPEQTGDADDSAEAAGFEFGVDHTDDSAGDAAEATADATHDPAETDRGDETGRAGETGTAADSGTDDRGGSPGSGDDGSGGDEEDAGGRDGGRASPSPSEPAGANVDRVESSSNRGDEEPAGAVAGPESVEVPGDGNDEIVERLEELTAAVEKQNELLTTQQRVIKALVKELRQGR